MMGYFFRRLIWGVHSVIILLFYIIIYRKRIKANWVQHIEKLVRITIANGSGKITIGKACHIKRGTQLHISGEGNLYIGNHVCINSNCYIAAQKNISIGNGCEIAQNVIIVDHDHDFRAEGGLQSRKYKQSPIKIGNNVWIGANTVILRGTVIGDNCVVGAGCILSGNYPSDTVIVQKRTEKTYSFK